MNNNKGGLEMGERGEECWDHGEGLGGKGRKLYLNNNKNNFKIIK